MIVVLAETRPQTDEWLEAMRARVIERASEANFERLLASSVEAREGEEKQPPRIVPGEGGPDLAIYRPSRRRPSWDFSDSATIVPPFVAGWANPDGSGDASDLVQHEGAGFFSGAVVDHRRALRNSGRISASD